MSAQRTERLLNLVIALLATRRWLTKEQLRSAVPQYAAATSDEAFDRMFERDKEDLRELGVPIRTGSHDPLFEDETGYRIRSEDYALPPIEVTPAELATLGLAAQAWQQARLGGPAARGLAKLRAQGLTGGEPDLPGVQTRLPTREPAFAQVYEAVRDRAPLRFGYLKEGRSSPDTRNVDPWRLRLWHGRWYLHGFDRDRAADRVFRLSRVRAPILTTGPAGTVTVPPDVDSRAAIERVWAAAPGGRAQVALQPGAGVALRAAAGAPPDAPAVELDIRDLEELAAQIAALGAKARVLAPPALADRVRDLLTGALRAHEARR